MYTQCPNCHAVFRVRADALAAARGQARCGRCGTEFDALASLTDVLPAKSNQIRRPQRATGPVDLHHPVAADSAAQSELFDASDAPTLKAEVEIARALPPAPTFVRDDPTTATRSGGWYALAALLALGLAVQLAWLFRTTLLTEPRVLAGANSLCMRLGCTLPAISQTDRIVLATRDVAAHPSLPHALKIGATLVNESPLAQSFPVVELVLADADGARLAMRRFSPAEYLAPGLASDVPFAPGASAELSLEVEDPGAGAVAFEFRFLPGTTR